MVSVTPAPPELITNKRVSVGYKTGVTDGCPGDEMLPTQRESTLQNRLDAFLKDLFKGLFKPPYRDDLAYLYKAAIIIALMFVVSVIAAFLLDPVFLLIAALISHGLALSLILGAGQDNRELMVAGIVVSVVSVAALVIAGVIWSPLLLAFAFAFAVTAAAECFRKRQESIPHDEKHPVDDKDRMSIPNGNPSIAKRSNSKIHEISKSFTVFFHFVPAVLLLFPAIGYTFDKQYLLGLAFTAATIIFVRYQIHSKPWRDPKYQSTNTLTSILTIITGVITLILIILILAIPLFPLLLRL